MTFRYLALIMCLISLSCSKKSGGNPITPQPVPTNSFYVGEVKPALQKVVSQGRIIGNWCRVLMNGEVSVGS